MSRPREIQLRAKREKTKESGVLHQYYNGPSSVLVQYQRGAITAQVY